MTNGNGAMEILFESETLHDEAQTGKTKFWKVYAGRQNGVCYTFSSHWQDGSIVQTAVPKAIEAKNVGRANQTDPADQAIAEAKSKFKKQQDKGYRLPGETASVRVLAMLAKNFRDSSHRLVYPCDLQMKLDGMRATTDGQTFWSREGRIINPEGVAHLRFAHIGPLVDGELMLPDFAPLEETLSAVKKYKAGITERVGFYRFDVCDITRPWSERKAMVAALPLPPQHFLVETTTVLSEAEAMSKHSEYTAAGWEGTIFRNLKGAYQPGKRPADIQKFKDWSEDEFEIVGFTDGQGREAGCIMFKCKTKSGDEFDVRPRGSLGVRQEMFKRGAEFIGKPYTVRYEIDTAYGKPRNPRGIAVRDYE